MKKTTLERLKVVARGVFFHILTLKCASHHNAVHFFDISTSKSGPSQFLTRLTSKCVSRIFAPQRRALYRHDNFQRCSEAKALLAFWLWNVFRAIAASTFSTSVIPKLLRTSCVLYVLTSTCASCPNGVHCFDISTSKSAPMLRCFDHVYFQIASPQRRDSWSLIWPDVSTPAALASLSFEPPGPQNIEKPHCLATFLPVAHFHLLSSYSFSSDSFSALTTVAAPVHKLKVWLPNFFRSSYRQQCTKTTFRQIGMAVLPERLPTVVVKGETQAASNILGSQVFAIHRTKPKHPAPPVFIHIVHIVQVYPRVDFHYYVVT